MKKGSCLCGGVSFVVTEDLGAPDACHCVQCRKHSGHYFASTNVPRDALVITGQENVSCSTCGSSLFWDPPARDWIAIAMGAFDTPTSTHLDRHIFVAEKGDYYEIADGLPRNQHF
jgi:hypothetical protein